MIERLKKYSFFEMMENSIVKVPIYQRDFVYGRMVDNSGRIKRVRTRLIDDLYNALDDDLGKKHELGIISGGPSDEKGDNKPVGEPVDGQQRLTVLFLLHWYVSFFGTNEKAKDIMRELKNFKYVTRTPVGTFCNKLIEESEKDISGWDINISEENINNYRNDNEPIISVFYKNLKEKTWFTDVIYDDPSVKSMIVILDEINYRFWKGKYTNHKGKKLSEVCDKFCDKLACSGEECPITYYCTPRKELGSADSTADLYIKMNSNCESLNASVAASILMYEIDNK